MKLYIVRHGETNWNILGRMQGCKDSPLSSKGRTNALLLGEKLQKINFDKVYSSPLGRAKETAELILADQDNKIEFVEDLREMSFGTWEGMSHVDIESKYPIQHYNFWNRPHLYQTINGESFKELSLRVIKALDKICSKSDHNILLITHTAVIKSIYSHVKGYPLEKFWGPPYIHDTCLNILEVRENKKEFILEADVSHIKKVKKVI